MPARGTRRRTAFPGHLGIVLLAVLVLASGAQAETALERARDLEARGEVAAAARAFLEAWKADPQSREAGLGLARTALAAEERDLVRQAEVTLAGLLHAAPEDAELGLALGRILLAQADEADSPNLARVLAHRARGVLAQLAEARPEDADVVLLLARAIELSGEPTRAVRTLDAWLESGRKAPPELVYAKGRILYDDAVRRHAEAGGTYPLPEEVRRMLARARDQFFAATVARPDDFDAWLHLAWAAQRLGEFEDALLGYEKALVLDPKSPQPLLGVHSLFANDPDGLAATLDRWLETHPEAASVLVYQAWRKLDAGEVAEARRLLELVVARDPGSADSLWLLGQLHTRQGEHEEAEAWYWRALEADPKHLEAAEAIDRNIRTNGLGVAKSGRPGLGTVLAEYDRLLAAAPENPFVRNNVAFLLREAWIAHRDDPTWQDVLDLSAEHYDAAVASIGRWSAERARDIPWARRYAFAQIVCDAGVLRFNFEPARDLVRAEFCLRESLEWSDDGYHDAWTYLAMILEQQERWKELHALALACADGLVNEAGEPLEAAREAARTKAARLEAEGRVD